MKTFGSDKETLQECELVQVALKRVKQQSCHLFDIACCSKDLCPNRRPENRNCTRIIPLFAGNCFG